MDMQPGGALELVQCEQDAVVLVMHALGGEPDAARQLVTGQGEPARVVTAFLLAERALAAARGRSSQVGARDDGNAVLTAASAMLIQSVAASGAVDDPLTGHRLRKAYADAVTVVVQLSAGQEAAVRAVLSWWMVGTAPGVAEQFAVALAEFTAAVITVVSQQRGEVATEYVRRWGLEIALDPLSRGDRATGVE